MKFLMITANRGFEKTIRKILQESRISTYSCQEVTGYKNQEVQQVEANWFGGDLPGQDSLMFYVFTEAEKTDQIFERITLVNAALETSSKIHLAVLTIERTNENHG